MFGLNIVQDIISSHIRFSQNRIQTHLMVVKLARINDQVLQDDCRWLKVDSETLGSEIR
jgi:pentose-5-phosphate-3-epimerase